MTESSWKSTDFNGLFIDSFHDLLFRMFIVKLQSLRATHDLITTIELRLTCGSKQKFKLRCLQTLIK